MRKTIILSVAALVIVGFVVYANSLGGKFIWDDRVLVENNNYIKSWDNLPRIFSEGISQGAPDAAGRTGFYRPAQILTYMLDYKFWGLNPAGYHFTNILLHILAALCVYWFINFIFRDSLVAFLSALLFIVHPVQTEAVSYISGRADSLALIFCLLSFILYLKTMRQKNAILYLVMLASFTLALLARENSLILPGLILLYHFTFKEKINRLNFFSILALFFIYIAVRLTVLRPLLLAIDYQSTVLQRVPGFFAAVADYIRLLLLPVNLHMEYGNRLFAPFHPAVITGLMLIFLTFFYALKKKDTDRLASFSIFWFFAALMPVSNIFPLNAYMAEHWLYLPSIGFFLFSARLLAEIYRKNNLKEVAISTALVLVFFLSILTIKQNSYWKEPITFFKRTLQYAPDKSRLYFNLGNAYQETGSIEEAITAYRQALKINPEYADAYFNLGNTLRDVGRREEAVESFKKAIESDPENVKAYNNLGNLCRILGRKEEAVKYLKKAIALNPDYRPAYHNLGLLYSDETP